MSSASLLDRGMAKDRKPASATVKIDPELLRKAQQIVAFMPPGEGGKVPKLTDFLDAILRGPIEREHAKLLKRLSRDRGEED